jgi:hypothetical protein
LLNNYVLFENGVLYLHSLRDLIDIYELHDGDEDCINPSYLREDHNKPSHLHSKLALPEKFISSVKDADNNE